MSAVDHVREIVRYIGEDVLDEVLVSNTALSDEAIQQYAKKGQAPVRVDEAPVFREVTQARITACPIGSERELVRHNQDKLAAEIIRLLDRFVPISSADKPGGAR